MILPHGIRAVVFDAVGTVMLPDPGAAVVYAEIALFHGIAIAEPEQLSARLWAQYRIEEQYDRENDWRTGEARERERWQRIVYAAIPAASERLFEELFEHFARPSAWRVLESAALAIAEFERQGLILGMGSNYDARLRRVVAGTPALLPLANHLVISSEVGYRKPSRQFFDAVRAEVGCEPHEILFFGDDPANDIEGATAAGMHAMLV